MKLYERDQIFFHSKRGLHLKRIDPYWLLVDPQLKWIYASLISPFKYVIFHMNALLLLLLFFFG